MAIGDNNNKKEDRKQRKAERQKAKVEKFKAGLDEQTPVDIGPLGAERKADIDKRIAESVEGDIREDLQKFQSRFKAPDVKAPDMPVYEPTIKDVRRGRRAKIADILTGFGASLRGERFDPSFYQDRLKRQRDEKYLQYRDIAEKGKKRLEEWEDYYTNEQIKYLEGLEDTEMSSLKKEKIRAEIDRLKRKPTTRAAGSGRVAFPTYEYRTDDGQTIKIPMHGKKEDLSRLTRAIQTAEDLKRAKEQIQQQMDAEVYRAESTGIFGLGKSKAEVQEEIRQKYADQLQKATQDVKDAENQIRTIFERGLIGEDGEIIEPETTIQQPTQETEVRTEEDDLWES